MNGQVKTCYIESRCRCEADVHIVVICTITVQVTHGLTSGSQQFLACCHHSVSERYIRPLTRNVTIHHRQVKLRSARPPNGGFEGLFNKTPFTLDEVLKTSRDTDREIGVVSSRCGIEPGALVAEKYTSRPTYNSFLPSAC